MSENANCHLSEAHMSLHILRLFETYVCLFETYTNRPSTSPRAFMLSSLHATGFRIPSAARIAYGILNGVLRRCCSALCGKFVAPVPPLFGSVAKS